MNTNKRLALHDFLAVLFILSAPYLHFVDYQEFRFEYLNLLVLACFALIAIAIAAVLRLASWPAVRVACFLILTLYFIDIQFDLFRPSSRNIFAATIFAFVVVGWLLRRHLSQILMVTFGVLILGTLATSLVSQTLHGSGGTANTVAPNRDLPVYVHIILDEQAGIEAFDNRFETHDAIRNEIMALFNEYGFRTFGRAFSHYSHSRDSISSLLNFSTSDTPHQWYTNGDPDHTYQLVASSYFEGIRSTGYKFNVYQSAYMDVCKAIGGAALTKCVTYRHHGLSSVALSELDFHEKAKIVLSMYTGLSFILKRLRQALEKLSDDRVKRSKSTWTDWLEWDQRVGPIPVLPVFDELIEDVATFGRGTMYFAHLLIPHSPYSMDAQCHIRRPVLRWVGRWSPAVMKVSDDTNSPESRRQSYDEYIVQIRCALSKLSHLFQVMETQGTLDDAIVIVHGDHGSRIGLVLPQAKNRSRLSVQDFHDSFTTLFAVKSPGLPSGYDSRMIGLPQLLRDSVVEQSGSISTAAEEAPFVYLDALDNASKLEKVSMPEIPLRDR